MSKLHLALIYLAILTFSACSGESQTQTETQEQNKAAKGGKYYGQIFRLAESEDIKTLFPPAIFDVYSYRVASQIYEGLFKFDMEDVTKLNPCLIESYEVDTSYTVYTFKLKKGIYFHDDPCFKDGKGREMTAKDVEYTFKWICSKQINNRSDYLLKDIVIGAQNFYDKSSDIANLNDEQIEGIKVIDDYTIRISLIKPNSLFLYNLARPGAFIFPYEAYEKYGGEMRSTCVGTGPFKLQALDPGAAILLERNPNYHARDEFGNKLPFLDRISIKFIKDKKIELKEFEQGKLDMVYRLPETQFFSIVTKVEEDSSFYLQRKPEMSTQILVFNNQKGIFKDKNIRKAFSYAINRNIILDKVLEGQGYDAGKYGFTPPVFPNYKTTKIKGYEYNLDSANYYLSKAGYGGGKGFPEVNFDLNVEAYRYVGVANEIQRQLKENLNIDVKINLHPHSQIGEKSVYGDFDMIRVAWVADYPSPQNYLWMLYSESVPDDPEQISYPNIPRYKNADFDKYYEQALTAKTQEEAMPLFLKAEQIMIKDAPILIMWYDEAYRVVSSKVKDFPINPMQYRDFSKVYKTP